MAGGKYPPLTFSGCGSKSRSGRISFRTSGRAEPKWRMGTSMWRRKSKVIFPNDLTEEGDAGGA